MEKKFIAAFGTTDAVITGVYAGLTVWRAVLTQLSGRVCIRAGWTLRYTRTVLVQEISCDQNLNTQTIYMIRTGTMLQFIALTGKTKCLHLGHKKNNRVLVGQSRSYTTYHTRDIHHICLKSKRQPHNKIKTEFTALHGLNKIILAMLCNALR